MPSAIPTPDHTLRTHLSAADPDLAALVARTGPCGLRVEADRAPYEALISAIAHQQLHGRAALAILGRLVALAGGAFPTPEALLALPEADLRACGLSGTKIRAIRGVAQARLDGVVPSRHEAESMTDEDLIARLTTLRGVGRWTVEMLLIFSLGRTDVMPVDDFGVREGWRVIKRLDTQPRPAELAALTRDWSPYRSAAAWYLWRAAEAAKAAAGRYVGP
ncbi:DNA-3-methyladenine glycosylase family protein [Gluconacetobacter sp. Hr-1-5]|uniref:DNA-3-methyladenine glycosylase family protein n=1 Tax=Gluconacetobacter sp. Hr-1-5 TaxID=3395370 RepID=UPI003B527B3A